ncbi:anthranilate synthase component I [Zooshikella ganghwensis]|uniref:anthranilate synthase component I n=1 Tax=Zooshikella ganghwensis TaxID=202772 RepID=UPI00041DDEB3|nr:anthranilate synthase component I [Zooshikella ganghwensis]
MTHEQFLQLAEQGYNRIPVTRELLADLDTPLSTYLKLADLAYTYLLESVHGGEKWGRYSIIGLSCRTVIKVFGHQVIIEEQGTVLESLTVDDPLTFIETYFQRFNVYEPDDLPRFNGGLVGYFSYDAIRYIESKLANSCPKDELHTPDILLMVSDDVVVFDNLSGKILLVTHVDPHETDAYQKSQVKLGQLVARMRRESVNAPHAAGSAPLSETDFVSSYGQEAFQEDVNKIKDYIMAGDAMQVVLSQQMQAPFSDPPINLYRALRCLNPSPYMYYFNLQDFYVVGSSPEILARVEDGEVVVRPIAGTRPRGKNPEEDVALEKDLLADPKELAEHLMLIDLGRNDIGRVAKTGTVTVSDQMVIERYSHVMHIVSNVTAQLKDNLTAMDVLKATLPAGTLSGAPKVRAMEIIDQLEPVKRGIYGGAVGYISWSGNMDTAIAIRTAVIKQNTLYIQAGAGVVADSQPEMEWQETLNKGRAVMRAAMLAQTELDLP